MPLASSLSSLRRVPASCQRARIFVFLEGLGLRLSASATGGETQVFSSMRRRAGRSASQGASASSRKAQQVSARAAGHPSSAGSLESRRGGEQVCSVAFSITAKKRPPFLQASFPRQTVPFPACDSLQRRLRGPPVSLAADIAPLRALPPGRRRRRRGRLELNSVGNPQPTSGISCEFRPPALVEFEALRGLLRRVAEEVEAEIKQVEKELAEARRGGGRGSWPLLETSCTRTSGLGLRLLSTRKS